MLASGAISNMINDLSDVKGDSSLSMMTEEDVEYDVKRATLNNTQSSYSKHGSAPQKESIKIPSPTKSSKVPPSRA